ncbi:MAG: hypothetical protein ACR2KW_02015 [Rubrobacter sp.]
MTLKNLKTLALATTAALFLASCGATEQESSSTDSSAQSGDSGSSSGTSTATESSGMEDSEMIGMEETTTGSEVTVGGFTVDAPGGGEVTVPEVAVRPEEAQAYLDEVRPVAEDSVRDISDLVEPEVSLENGNISLGLNVNSLDEARQSIEDGADQLREIQPPDGLEDVNERLIQVYEDAIPAYQDVVDAAESGDPQEITDVVQQSLSDIERFDSQVDAIVQDVQQAAEGQPQ